MATPEQIKRRQLIQTAEGYLDLAVMFEDQWTLDETHRRKLASRAIECLNEIRKPLGHKPQILFLKGQAHRIAGRFVQASKFFEQSTKLDPDNLHGLLALAWCYKRTGKLELAIAAMEDALKVEPESAIAHYNLACYGALNNNLDLAVLHLSLALDLNAEYRELVDSESDFDPIRDEDRFREVLEVNA